MNEKRVIAELERILTDIANTIRNKKNTSEPINIQDMAREIENIPMEGTDPLHISRLLEEINGDNEVQSYTVEFVKLKNTKEAIKQAIINKGGVIDDNTPFSDYAMIINTLNVDGSTDKIIVTVDENGDLMISNGGSMVDEVLEIENVDVEDEIIII